MRETKVERRTKCNEMTVNMLSLLLKTGRMCFAYAFVLLVFFFLIIVAPLYRRHRRRHLHPRRKKISINSNVYLLISIWWLIRCEWMLISLSIFLPCSQVGSQPYLSIMWRKKISDDKTNDTCNKERGRAIYNGKQKHIKFTFQTDFIRFFNWVRKEKMSEEIV